MLMTPAIRRWAFAVVALLPAAVLAQSANNLGDQRLAPIDDPLRVEFRSAPPELSLDSMRQAIRLVGAARGWKVVTESTGSTQLTRTVNGRHMMKVEIDYDPAGYDILYIDSAELMYRQVGGVRAIHRNYNLWVRELATSIDSGLGVSASMSVATRPRATAPQPALAAAPAAAAATEQPEHASSPLPRQGDFWKYSFRDERYRRRVEYFTVDVTEVHGSKVVDLLGREGSDADRRVRRTIDVQEFAFVNRRLHADYFTRELAPYLADSARIGELQVGAEPEHGQQGWRLRVTQLAQERVRVPAGEFDATRVEVTAVNQLNGAGTGFVQRRIYTFWYAAEPKRYVMLRHQAWVQGGSMSADEIVRLEEYRLR